jgi:glycine/D-amino acid oxidase-like deaminating enzyme
VLDEGDVALRASRGNFALIWVQTKGLGMPAYSHWTLRSSDSWAAFAAELEAQTGIDVSHARPGGFTMTLSEREWEHRARVVERLLAQPGMPPLDMAMLDRAGVQKVFPQIGPDVTGASFCAQDGHCNSLRLLRALNQGMQMAGAAYLANAGVERIECSAGGFLLLGKAGEVRAAKVVLAAGNDNARLAPMVGLEVPVRPQRGQLIVTERTRPFLHHPISTLRQTDEGGVLIGDSQEEEIEPAVGMPVISLLADRAVRTFPQLGALNVVRTWAALRVMTLDGFPIYDESTHCPGAFAAACHSGVTLAAGHALVLAPCIAAGRLPPETFQPFSSRRFHVQAPA